MELRVSQLQVVLIYNRLKVEGINFKSVGAGHVMFAWVVRIWTTLRI